jgi:molybdate/tungstate transport system ATP-binding protein
MIEAAAIRKKLGHFMLDVTMVEDGFICLAGKNGSGKTTLMRIVAGLTRADGGRLRIAGEDVTDLPVDKRRVVMVTPASFIPNLQVERHLQWGARLRGVEVSIERLGRVKRELGIDFPGQVGRLSMGMRERVALATALLSSPSVILVDEAFANLHEKESFVTAYRELATESKIDIIFSTQDVADGGLAEHLYLMDEGTVRKSF